uniref:Uncharacterized protein n=1 Tax=Klebsiella pneumoniae TaxID=573 RepID=A0A8B0SRP8_KLEPN|nr:hypothetical protein [Klebsiella pneumoniae]
MATKLPDRFTGTPLLKLDDEFRRYALKKIFGSSATPSRHF